VPDNGLTIEEILQPVAATNQLQLKSYHVFTNRWVALNWPDLGGELPQMIAVDQRWWLLSEREGVPALQSAQLFYAERHFSWLDYAAMCIYLIALVAIGKYFARRDKGTDYFFLGGRKIPWWAAGLSIYATGTSAISFMAIPAKTYMTDWLYFIGMSIFPFFTLILAAYLFIPMLRRLEITTVMEYFDLRFGKSVRFLMSFVGVMGQVAGRMSITLLLPSLALTAVTGMDLYLCILVMGILATIYTVMGGISAVIWTDVLQVAVLFGGAILSFFLIIAKVDGGFGQMITLGINDNKFNFFDFRPDLTTATMWIMLLWAVSDVFGKGLGQEGLQRAFSTPDVKSARRSMITCAVVALPAGFLFYGIGTALYAFYHQHPELLNPTLQSDAIFPLFIAQQLPIGIAGLVISALFAAAMSTLDTAMNSVSAILTRDYYSVFKRDADERSQMRFARWVTISCGVIGTGIALYMASFENLGSLWDRFSIILALIGGGLGGVGALALMTTRANTAGTLLGAALTTVFVYWLRFFAPTIPGISPLHFFAYGTATLAVGFASGYVFSIVISAVFPQYGKKDLTGLTFWTATK
jgi:SSS family transporter